MNLHRAPLWAGLALLAAALVLYLATLDNGLRPGELAGGDLITHQYAQVQARPSNAPGYPLYTLGGWLWFYGLRSALGQAANATAILSAYSTLWALLALALLYLTLLEAGVSWLLSLLLGAFYAVTYFFWFYAVSTEQYASAVAQTLAIVLLAWRWERAVEAAGSGQPSRRADRYLLALAFLCGLSLAHLVTVAFIVPPLLWFILDRQPGVWRRPRLLAQAAGLALLPLLSYAFVYVRGAQHPEWRGAGQWSTAWGWFWEFVSTRQGRGELTWSFSPLWTADFPSLIWRELTWIVMLGGLLGLLALGRRRGGLIGGALLLYLAFSFVDRLGNWYQVIMPAYALLVVSCAAGLQWLWTRLAAEPAAGRGRPVTVWPGAGRAAIVAGLIALVGLRFAWSLPQANQRNRPEDTALLPGLAILADAPAPGAAVLGAYTQTLSLRYLTDIWGERPDVAAVDSPTASQLLKSGARPLYVTRQAVSIVAAEIDPQAHLSSAGAELIAVTAEPASALPAAARPLERPVGDGLTLAGYEVGPAGPGRAGQQRVRLYWRAEAPIEHDWAVSLRPTRASQLLTSPDGIVQVDRSSPVHGAYPTTGWTPGEVVADDYVLTLPAGQSMDGLQVIVYRPLPDASGFENLAQVDWPLSGEAQGTNE